MDGSHYSTIPYESEKYPNYPKPPPPEHRLQEQPRPNGYDYVPLRKGGTPSRYTGPQDARHNGHMTYPGDFPPGHRVDLTRQQDHWTPQGTPPPGYIEPTRTSLSRYLSPPERAPRDYMLAAHGPDYISPRGRDTSRHVSPQDEHLSTYVAPQRTSPRHESPKRSRSPKGKPQSSSRRHRCRTRRATTTWEKYNPAASRVLGVMSVVVGCLCVLFDIIGIGLQELRKQSDNVVNQDHYNFTFYIASGIWCSVFFFICGGLAIEAAKRRTKCMIISTMVMAGVSAVFAGVLIACYSLIVARENDDRYHWQYPDDYLHLLSLTMGALVLMLSIMEVLFCFALVLFECSAMCCDTNSSRPTPSRRGRPSQSAPTYIPLRSQSTEHGGDHAVYV